MQLYVVAVNRSKRSLEVLSISFDHILSIDIVLHKITMGNQEIELFTCDTPRIGCRSRVASPGGSEGKSGPPVSESVVE